MVILMVDDDHDDRDLFVEAIHVVGPDIKCVIADSGKRALELLEDGLRPDYIFLDINMPEMTGKQVLAAIKEDKRFGNIRVIMNSTTFDPREINNYRKLGCDDFMIKPGKFEKLCQDIKDVLML